MGDALVRKDGNFPGLFGAPWKGSVLQRASRPARQLSLQPVAIGAAEKIEAKFGEIVDEQMRKNGIEAARWLAAAGGSEPDMEYILRRRSEPAQ